MAGKRLSEAAAILTDEERRDIILKIIIELAEDTNEENKIVAV